MNGMRARALTRKEQTTAKLVNRMLDEPAAVSALRELTPRQLGAVVRHVGLEDAGELLCLASGDQLVGLFDLDLWRDARDGHDERFDSERFARWIEVIAQATSDEEAAALWSAQDEDLLGLGLASRVMVLDLDALAPQLSAWAELGLAQAAEVDRLDKALEGSLGVELEGCRVIARESHGFDAIVELLLALDRDHRDLVERLLARLAALGAERLEEEGPAELLSAAQSLAEDVAGAREDRRSAEGYVAPSAAAAFLRLATQQAESIPTLLQVRERDPLTRAYFRQLHRTPPAETPRPCAGGAPGAARSPGQPMPSTLAELLSVAEVEIATSSTPALPPVTSGIEDAAETLRAGLRGLGDRAPEIHEQRLHELVYLANVLVAAGDVARRRYGLAEAADAVLATCDRGAGYLVERGEGLDDMLREHGADWLFRLGWALSRARSS